MLSGQIKREHYSEIGKLIPAGIYSLIVNNRNTRTRCEICSNLTIKTREENLI